MASYNLNIQTKNYLKITLLTHTLTTSITIDKTTFSQGLGNFDANASLCIM